MGDTVVRNLGGLSAILLALGSIAACGDATGSSAPDEESVDSVIRVSDDSGSFQCQPFTPFSDLGAMEQSIRDARTLNGLVGGDVATSVRLDSGNIMFAFGDSILDTSISPKQSVRNSILGFSKEWSCLVLGPNGSAFVPDRADGVGYWPMSMAQPAGAEGDVVALFVNRVRGTGELGKFVNLGPAVVRVTLDDSGIPSAEEVIEMGADSESTSTIAWGAASWATDDYVYVFGTSSPGEDMVFGWALHVARSLPGTVFDPAQWEFWDGEQWTSEATSSAALIAAEGGVSQTLSVFEQDDKWYAISKKDDFLGEDVDVWLAPGPTGPFDDVEIAGNQPSDLEAGILRYTALAHPTLFPQPGTIVLSISVNTTHFERISSDPNLYRPEFWRAKLP